MNRAVLADTKLKVGLLDQSAFVSKSGSKSRHLYDSATVTM